MKMHLDLTPETLPDAVGWNVIGDLKGSEHPEQVVIMSGHLDSWDLATGAIDDAAGVGSRCKRSSDQEPGLASEPHIAGDCVGE